MTITVRKIDDYGEFLTRRDGSIVVKPSFREITGLTSVKQILKIMREKKDDEFAYKKGDLWINFEINPHLGGVELYIKDGSKRYSMVVEDHVAYFYYYDKSIQENAIYTDERYDYAPISFIDGIPAVKITNKKASNKQKTFIFNEFLKKVKGTIPYEPIDDFEEEILSWQK